MQILSNIHSLGFKFSIRAGVTFIVVGLLILLLKEIIILILASIFISIGIYLLALSYRIWKIKQIL